MNKTRSEKKYELYVNGNMDAKYKELEAKLNEKPQEHPRTKQEYEKRQEEYAKIKEEYEKMSKIKANLPKVKNLIDAKTELLELREAIIDELSQRSVLDKENKEIEKQNKQIEIDREKIANELANLMAEEESITKALKADNLSDKERENLNKKLEQNKEKKAENDRKYLENQNAVVKPAKVRTVTTVLSKLSKKELTDKAINLKITIDRYDFYIANLMKGQDLETIKGSEVAKDWKEEKKKYRQELNKEVKNFTSNKAQRDKIKKLQEIENNEKNKNNEIPASEIPVNEVPLNETPVNEVSENESANEATTDENENKLALVSSWREKHPKISQFISNISNWFKNIPSNLKNQAKKWGFFKDADVNEKETPVTETPVTETPVNEAPVNEAPANENSRRTAFLKDLKFFEGADISEVAENGFEEVRKKEQHNAKVNAMRTLIENKKKARGDDGGTIASLEEKLKALEDGNER